MLRIVLASLLFVSLAGPSAAEKLRVVSTITIVGDMARNVAGDAAEVSTLIPPGSEIHNFQPTPSDIRTAGEADLILWNGMGLEVWFERFFRNLPQRTIHQDSSAFEAAKEPSAATASDIVSEMADVVEKSKPVNALPRVGRNDPCPCGSGKKFKQCCGKPG